MKSSQITRHIQENKTLFTIIVVGLFLLELEIFALAAMTAGKQSFLQVLDTQGNVIHQSSGKNLSDFKKEQFERIFGPVANYTMRLHNQETPFPFRAWFVAAICVPIGAMMLFGFIVKAYLVLFYKEAVDNATHHHQPPGSEGNPENKLDSTLNRISRMNIFNIGFLIFVGVVSYWIVPNALTFLGHLGIEFFTRFKWVYIGMVVIVVCVVIWIIYLRYKLAKKSIESQTEIQKHRLSLEYHFQTDDQLLLESPSDEIQNIIDYKPEDEITEDKGILDKGTPLAEDEDTPPS